MSAPRLVEHFFRHEYGRLVATLSRRLGVQHLEAVEDAVQSALMTALETWTVAGLPDNPSGWLFRVAHNDLVGELRQRTRRGRILGETRSEPMGAPEDAPEPFLAGEMQDDLLRMLFVCCDDGAPLDSVYERNCTESTKWTEYSDVDGAERAVNFGDATQSGVRRSRARTMRWISRGLALVAVSTKSGRSV